jgi:peptide/nickel transport system substrate-binding protein
MSIRAAKLMAFAATILASASLPALAQQAQPRTLIVAAPQTPTGFDGDIPKVATRQMITQANEGLVRYARITRPDGTPALDPSRIEANLAERWTVSEDGRTYVFTLRRGVRSPWGNELSADDIVWSFERAWHIRRTSFFLYNLLGVESFTKTGDHEVTIRLRAPNKIFLAMLTMYFPTIHDRRQVLANAPADDPWGLRYLDQNLVGFGPYFLESLRPGEQVVLRANPNWFRGTPFYERVIYREVPSVANRVALLRTGQVQWVEDLPLRQIAELKRDRNVRVESVLGTQPASIRMNPGIAPFNDRRVREAMTLATDVDAFNRAVFEGLGEPVRSIVPPTVPGAVAIDPPRRDVARARALLAEAGHPNGLEVTLNYAGTYWWMEPVAIQFRTQMAEAGITVNLQRLPDPEFIRRGLVNTRDMALFPQGDPTFVLDPVFTAWIFGFSSGVANRNAYNNPEFDRLITAALPEFNDTRRNELMAQAQRIHAQDMNWIGLHYPGIHQAMASCIRGWIWNPDDWPRFSDLRCER